MRKSTFQPHPTCISPESPAGPSRWSSRYGNNLDAVSPNALPSRRSTSLAVSDASPYHLASPSRRPSHLSITPSSYFHQLHLDAPTPGLARRDSMDSQTSAASSLEDAPGTLVTSTSTGQLAVSHLGLPRKASYNAHPGAIYMVKADEESPLPSPTGLLKKLAQRHSTSLRSIRQAGSKAGYI